jgi:hypothetical protein
MTKTTTKKYVDQRVDFDRRRRRARQRAFRSFASYNDMPRHTSFINICIVNNHTASARATSTACTLTDSQTEHRARIRTEVGEARACVETVRYEPLIERIAALCADCGV